MRRTPLGQHALQLTRFGFVNCAIVREDDGLTLVDAALPGTAPAILAAAESLGAPIRRVLLTHAHPDHVGAVDALLAARPGLELLVGAREARLLAGDRTLDPAERPDATARMRGGTPSVRAAPTRLLDDGALVGNLRVVASPGHTPGHLAFLDERDGTLHAGDALHTFAGMQVSGTFRWRFPISPYVTWHPATALRSAERLQALAPARVATGHGPIVERPLDALTAAIAEARRAVERRGVPGRAG